MSLQQKLTPYISITSIPIICLLMIGNSVVQAQNSGEWECTQQNCEAPNKPREKAKNYEVQQDRKFELKIKKTLAKEEKKFDKLGRQNKNVLELDKKKRGNFGVWAFPNNGN